MRMTKDQVVAVGTRAIEARFPGATKGRTFAAFMIADGYWAISVQRGGRPLRFSGGDPVGEVRDRDGKVVSVLAGEIEAELLVDAWRRRRGALQIFERFVIAFALKKVGELRIDRAWQGGGEIVDFF